MHAAVSALAENPSRIKKIFLTQNYKKANGIVALKAYVGGAAINIKLDDYFLV